jgi:hypothetical protein
MVWVDATRAGPSRDQRVRLARWSVTAFPALRAPLGTAFLAICLTALLAEVAFLGAVALGERAVLDATLTRGAGLRTSAAAAAAPFRPAPRAPAAAAAATTFMAMSWILALAWDIEPLLPLAPLDTAPEPAFLPSLAAAFFAVPFLPDLLDLGADLAVSIRMVVVVVLVEVVGGGMVWAPLAVRDEATGLAPFCGRGAETNAPMFRGGGGGCLGGAWAGWLLDLKGGLPLFFRVLGAGRGDPHMQVHGDKGQKRGGKR